MGPDGVWVRRDGMEWDGVGSEREGLRWDGGMGRGWDMNEMGCDMGETEWMEWDGMEWDGTRTQQWQQRFALEP